MQDTKFMSQYNEQYFFIVENDEEHENLPYLGEADANTRNRKHSYERQPQGSAPLMFHNNYKEKYKKRGVDIMNPLPSVLFRATNILITTEIRRELLKYNIPNMYTHPSVYIHDDDEWHEDYWFCTFTERFDCWDRKASKYMHETFEPNDYPAYAVYKYSLNEEFLDGIPLEQRLLFKMGASALPMITCHESIKHLFENEGSQTIPVTEWG
jgi:hypothetical protein